jgi:hypothetical protein
MPALAFAIASMYSEWTSPADIPLLTFSLVTVRLARSRRT